MPAHRLLKYPLSGAILLRDVNVILCNTGIQSMKQINIEFSAENTRLPLNYSSLMLSVIKNVVEASDPGLYNEWFDKTRNLGKSYTFSVSLPRPSFRSDAIQLDEPRFALSLTTFDVGDLMNLYNAFVGAYQRRQTFLTSGNSFWIRGLSAQTLPPIGGSSALVKFESPLIARLHDRETNRDRFLDYTSPDFVAALRYSAERAVAAAGLSCPVDDFELVPVKPRKTVVHYFRNMRITANLGVFEAHGSPALLNFLRLSGVGAATGSGHGKFKVL